MISYLYEATDYNRMINEADTLEKLISGLEKISPFADDALIVAKTLDDKTFKDYRHWLKEERKGNFQGEEKTIKYGAILIPVIFIDCHFLQETFKVPLGTACNRILEIKQIDYIRERQKLSTRHLLK